MVLAKTITWAMEDSIDLESAKSLLDVLYKFNKEYIGIYKTRNFDVAALFT